MKTRKFFRPFVLLGLSLGLVGSVLAAPALEIPSAPFGKTKDGQEVRIYTLRNANGMEARITNYGGIIVKLLVPDRDGKLADVALGYDKLEDYTRTKPASPYFGALIGRYGNRIAKGKFTLDGKQYTLAINNGPNALHGGLVGFDKVVWQAKPIMTRNGPALILTYTSKDGEEGYPGTLKVHAVYTLTNKNGLRLDFTATTDKDTVVNLTNHNYFNLAGAGSGDVLGQQVQIFSKEIVPVDQNLIPTGKLRPVAGTPFDFSKPTAIGARIAENDEQLKFGNGYDHCFVIDKPMGRMGRMARVVEPASGRVLEVLSTEPALQFYSGNFLDGTNVGKGGKPYNFRNAFVMEPEHYPDSPNQPNFPSTKLKPGQTYRHTMIYQFSVQK